ncbi:RING and UBP finger domain-containing protein [Cordyceps javanica]|uniref:RING and UBP finger domain-containing protein n=1 Tax=Cordyceps javanica TaxID=43265 RepID=A0A545V8W3_9HYPO|nr:RING and UBP finger domain-containing protein [Cordyceps javanica]TQW08670.1 RING and UBP finger domain protein [Cordyceps javanica]
MPSYFYHLKFELYPTSDPTAIHATAGADIWLPTTQTSVFEDLPAHPPPVDETRASHDHEPLETLRDWRFGRVSIQTIDPFEAMAAAEAETGRTGAAAAPALGPNFSGPGTATKAACVGLNTRHTNVGWGVVHFYRDEQESSVLRLPEADRFGTATATKGTDGEEDCSTLCIPAVPAYMSPGDLWGFVGERWRDDISHCRMVMTSKMNRYLVLLKFRHGKVAREWKKQFDGTVFNTMEPQVCHVVFVKSITFEAPSESIAREQMASLSSVTVSNTPRPFPPPTPDLVELPTCPVCLERMDETSGIMTIPCSHVFHCTCLQNWKGGGCPVCRFTNTVPGSGDDANPYSRPFGSDVSNLCSVCDSADDLWICLICGSVGCGRYKGGHAKDHWKETAHSFALELETQYVWDYAGDVWVHRLIRDKGDGKVVELPGRSSDGPRAQADADEDVVPRAKLDNMGFEYTHLLTSQLESQRAYYEEMLHKAVNKASKASAAAESTARQASDALERYGVLDERFQALSLQTVPHLERDLERERAKAARSETLARSLGKSLQEEKKVNEGLMRRIEHLGAEGEETRRQLAALGQEMAELREMNRDLSMFISGQEKLREMEQQGQLQEGELQGGSASVPEKKSRRRGKR